MTLNIISCHNPYTAGDAVDNPVMSGMAATVRRALI